MMMMLTLLLLRVAAASGRPVSMSCSSTTLVQAGFDARCALCGAFRRGGDKKKSALGPNLKWSEEWIGRD
jgi:hypothetical protein